MMSKFKTQYTVCSNFQESGKDETHTYTPYFNDLGEKHLKIKDYFSQSEFINSSIDLCQFIQLKNTNDLGNYLNLQSSFNIDDVLQSDIFDITQLPTSKGDMFKTLHNSEIIFNGLDSSIREKFNFNSKLFFSKFGSKEFIDMFIKKDIVNESEVKE